MKYSLIVLGTLVCCTFFVKATEENLEDSAPSFPTSTETNTIQDNGCEKYPPMSPDTPIKFDQISGTWYAVRAGPPCEGAEDHEMECMSETYWQEMDTPREEFKSIMSFRNNTKKEFWGMTGHLKYLSPDSKKIEREMIFTANSKLEEMPPIPCTVAGTDAGKTWLLWNCCMMFPPNVTNSWVIMSRTPLMDAKLEQTLVEYVGKIAGVSPNTLRGIKQTECH